MSNIAKAFANGKAFIPFVTCGDPDLETTANIVRAMAEAGADLIELGIPFSDPTAEGPVIQSANVRALSAGTTTDRIFDLVQDLRKDVTIPMVFMTYANVVFSYGAEKFISTCQEIGIDGLILPDIPYEEKDEFDPICKRYGVDLISMVAPTSEDRIAMVELIRANSSCPCAVGFGISTPEQAKKMAGLADGAIVGSAIVKLIAQYGREAVPYVADYVKQMKEAVLSCET